MRRITPVSLVLLMAAVLVPAAAASVPVQRHSSDCIPALSSEQVSLQALPGQISAPLDPRPFSTEFYLRQFVADANSRDARQQRSRWLSPVTSAASSLSKTVASWRRALVRMMP